MASAMRWNFFGGNFPSFSWPSVEATGDAVRLLANTHAEHPALWLHDPSEKQRDEAVCWLSGKEQRWYLSREVIATAARP